MHKTLMLVSFCLNTIYVATFLRLAFLIGIAGSIAADAADADDETPIVE